MMLGSNRKLFIFSFVFCFSCFTAVIAQKGKHGALTVSTLNTRVNEFTSLTANASAGNSTIIVANSALNTNSRFSTPLQVGDLIMIMQMQGAVIKTFNDVPSQDSTYGEILNYNGAGNYEFAQVFAIPNANSIVLDCDLMNNYLVSGRTQIIRIPRLTSLIVNAGASLTTDNWNGTIGGVLAVEVDGLSTINGTVTSTGLGFRGALAENNGNYGGGRFVDLGGGANEGGYKGESIAGYTVDLNTNFNGAHAKGAPANGGGGGNSHNAGGGGGANAGNINGWIGYGVINPSYTLAYSLEFAGRENIVSSGGGRGGYAFSSANLNPNTVPPGSTTWSGDSRRNQGGFGGRPLDYSTGRIYLGGGGGSGHVNNINAQNTGGTGGNGGGLIYFLNFGNITGNGIIESNGAPGVTATGPYPGNFSSNVNGNDPGGGGGAGGTVILATGGNVSGVTINANGGRGGDQIIVKGGFAGSNTEAEGPGGGGGGGYIALSNGTPAQNVLGASSGTTNSTPFATLFPPNGASNGDEGLKEQDIKFYTIDAPNATVCINQSATLTATTNNPLVSSFTWYNSAAGVTQIGTGAVFTTSVFTAPGTYTVFAGMCPGHYRQPVIITVNNPPTITVNSATICASETATLTASGGLTYTWSTASNAPSITVSPTTTTVYTVSATNICDAQATATVEVQAPPTLTLTPSSTLICNSQSVTLSATGTSGTYSWSNGASGTHSIAVNTPGTYTVTLTNNCGTATQTISLSEGIGTSINISASQNTICSGGSVTLTANATGTINWSTGDVNVSSVTVTNTGVYSATVMNECGTAVSSFTVDPGPLPGLNLTTSMVCEGQTATVVATGGATSYTWSNGATGPVVTTTVAGMYSVVATNSCGTSTGTVLVNILALPTISLAASQTIICEGQSASLFASANQSPPTFSWSSSTNTSSIESVNTAGIYFVTYSTMCGSPSASISIFQSTLVPDFVFSPQGGYVPLAVSFTNNSVNNNTNTWNFGNGQGSSEVNPSGNFTAPGVYTINLVIQNSDGCLAAISRTIEVTETPFGIIPELITPNNDGLNETFEIKGLNRFPNNELEVYNRWGNLVYSKVGYDNSWDGHANFRGESKGKLPVGTYYYILKLNDAQNTVYKGFVQLQY